MQEMNRDANVGLLCEGHQKYMLHYIICQSLMDAGHAVHHKVTLVYMCLPHASEWEL